MAGRTDIKAFEIPHFYKIERNTVKNNSSISTKKKSSINLLLLLCHQLTYSEKHRKKSLYQHVFRTHLSVIIKLIMIMTKHIWLFPGITKSKSIEMVS